MRLQHKIKLSFFTVHLLNAIMRFRTSGAFTSVETEGEVTVKSESQRFELIRIVFQISVPEWAEMEMD